MDALGRTVACTSSLFLSTCHILVSAVIRSAWLLFQTLASFLVGFATNITGGNRKDEDANSRGCRFYQGTVLHRRKLPVSHRFSYSVRVAYVDMDNCPLWFKKFSGQHHLSADQARALSGTKGKVFLLTNPVSVGFEQNPISVYYCFEYTEGEENLKMCIAEVTNTPWGERCTFTFTPEDGIPKPLHVSPFMDMNSTWLISTHVRGSSIHLKITASHPQHGEYFFASLIADQKENVENPFWFFWLMPHKVAVGIYWQALCLWWKGVPLKPHPKYSSGNEYKEKVLLRKDNNATRYGCVIQWQEAPSWPWK